MDDTKEALITFFAAHRPLPCVTDYPDERSSWYACTCKKWASAKTKQQAEWHHIVEFEKHMAEVLATDYLSQANNS